MTLETARGGGGHMGSGDYNLVFRNTGRATCVMAGYPVMIEYDAAGRVVSRAAPVTGRPVATVILAPGGQAYADVNVYNPHVGNVPCPATPVTVRVTPPNASTALALSAARTRDCTYEISPVAAKPYG
jgi:hypothetical protein